MKLFELFGEIKVDNKEANDNIDETDKKGKNLGDSLKSAGGKAMAAGKTIGVGLGIAVGAAGAATTQIAETTDRIDKMSQNMGFSTGAFQEWDFVISQTGGDIEQVAGGLAGLTEKAIDATNGGESNAEAFAKLGISVDDLAGATKEEIFEKTIKGLQSMTDEAERSALASELLGGAGEEMGALLNMTADEVDALKQQANDLGLVLGEDVVAAGVNMTDQLDIMQRSFMTLLAEALVPLMPVFMELIGVVMELLPPIMELIKPLMEALVPVLSQLIQALLPPFAALLSNLMPILTPLINIFTMLVNSALMPVIEALTPIINALLPPLASLLEALMPLIEGVATVFSAVLGPVIEIVTGIFEGFMGVVGGVIDVVGGVIGVIGDAIGAIGDFLGAAGDVVGDVIGGVGDFVGGLLPSFDVGTSYVPYDMVAKIHKGERILTADENEEFMKGNLGGGGNGIQIVINDAQIINDQAMEDFADKLTNYITGNGVLV